MKINKRLLNISNEVMLNMIINLTSLVYFNI